jgi:DUF4097 and DUF4098 domain-containing protein YvlB
MKYTVDVELEAGSVQVIAEERDAPSATVEPADGSAASQDATAKTRVELRGDTFYVHAPKSRRLLGRSAKLTIEIRTPLGSNLKAETASADVTCRGRLGEVAATTASGHVEIERATGDAHIKTASARVRAANVDGDLRVETASGDVSSRYTGGVSKISTASGDVEIEQANSDVRVSTASGDVMVGTPRHGDVQAKSASGDVTLRVPAGTGVWFDMSTVSGGIRTDLDVSTVAPAGGHDLAIRVRTLSGDIEVFRLPQPAPAA